MIRAAISLMLGNLASKFLGLAREVLFAAWFGTSEVAAAFRIAQSLIFVSIHSLVGDTLAGGMLPLYQRLRGESEARGRALLCVVLAQGLLIGCVLGGGMFFLADHVVALMAPGASVAAKTLAANMVRIMSVVAPLYILGNTLAYIESAHGKYTTLSSRTSLANVGIILAGAVAVWLKQPLSLAIGFVLVYAIFLAVTILDFIKTGLFGHIAGEIARPLGPVIMMFERNIFSLLGILLVAQGNVFAERVVASWLGTSTIPALDYARFLTDTLTVMLAVPLGIITLASHGGSSTKILQEHASKIGRLLITITVPLSVIFLIGADDLVRIIYKRGAFDEHSVMVTSGVLRGAAVGLFATVTAYFLVKVMNTALRNKETLLVTAAAAVVNIAFNMLAWRALGPVALGIGNSLYGLVLLISCITMLGLWRGVGTVIWQNLLVGAAAAGLLCIVPHTAHPFVNLVLIGVVVGGAWLGLYGLSPAIRDAASPIMQKVFNLGAKLGARMSR